MRPFPFNNQESALHTLIYDRASLGFLCKAKLLSYGSPNKRPFRFYNQELAFYFSFSKSHRPLYGHYSGLFEQETPALQDEDRQEWQENLRLIIYQQFYWFFSVNIHESKSLIAQSVVHLLLVNTDWKVRHSGLLMLHRINTVSNLCVFYVEIYGKRQVIHHIDLYRDIADSGNYRRAWEALVTWS